ncbi:MAG: DUF2283 domain-containing protein [Crenarchaeota archaeon]|nr:DUF2283 domain-containing protein [Thermoproteota archaeon]
MSGEERVFKVRDLDDLWFDYDRQNDILYINFGPVVEDADEEYMVGDYAAVRIKDGFIVSIMVFDFLKRIGLR